MPIIALLLFISGFTAGSLLKKQFFIEFLGMGSNYLYLIYRPVHQFVRIRYELYSNNKLERLKAYYALYDYNYIDVDFLAERYRLEDSHLNKRTIVWILGNAPDRDKVKRFINKEFEPAERDVQLEMLGVLNRMGQGVLRDFIQERHIPKALYRIILGN